MESKIIIENRQFDEERALYHLSDARVRNCVFAGPADGESALKEAQKIAVEDCSFSLRYPLWHVADFSLTSSVMDADTRAAIWYAADGTVADCKLGGIKAVRECSRISLKNCEVDSEEFGWKSKEISLTDTKIVSQYLFLGSRDVELLRVNMQGKYSFQYVENLKITDCNLDTKDAFWHSKNVTVENSTVKGEYLGWFSEGLTLAGCRIIGTQPLCYCKNLRLVDCTMEDTDLSFEYSDVEADIKGHIVSVKNPKSGRITADSVGEIIMGNAVMDCTGTVVIRSGSQ